MAKPKGLRTFKATWNTCSTPTPGGLRPFTTPKTSPGTAAAPRIYLKREDLAHTGAHKINNALGQALLARHMGKERIIAETGAGQHGVAAATACAMLGLGCIVYMGSEDVARQSLNVFRMKLLGAEVIPVESGTRTLKDAINEAIRDWVTNVDTTHYLIGSVVGPHPYPMLVRDFQTVIGKEARQQVLSAEGRLPDYVVACVGGGSNAIGAFHPFVADEAVGLVGVEAGGRRPGQRPALGLPQRGSARRAPRVNVLPAAGRTRPGPRDPQHLRWAGLPRRGTRAQLSQRLGPGGISLRRRRAGPGGVPPTVSDRGDHTRGWSRPTRSSTPPAWRPNCLPIKSSWSVSAAGATRTSRSWPGRRVSRFDPGSR